MINYNSYGWTRLTFSIGGYPKGFEYKMPKMYKVVKQVQQNQRNEAEMSSLSSSHALRAGASSGDGLPF